MSNYLKVYLYDRYVGKLWLDEERKFNFQYDINWLENQTSTPLSLSLPLQAEVFGDKQAKPFFSNLLPEAELRINIARRIGLSEKNDYALLEAVGGECAGAVKLLPEEQELLNDGYYQTLSDIELNKLIQELPRRPMMAGENGLRLSLAGVQNKLPVSYDGSYVGLPHGDAASSHILKPPIRNYPYSVENETFCMRLADRMGLGVPAIEILEADTRLYLIERYDRKVDAQGKITRLHQEDFCQALSVSPEIKYEKEGGPSLQDCFNLIRHQSIQPVIDLRVLLGWVVFNYLIGNADSHAKNISLLLTPDGPKLAPFYDLMSTAVYPELTDRLAMKMGGDDRPKWILKRHWQQLANDIGMGHKLIEDTLLSMNDKIVEEAASEANSFYTNYGECEIIDKILAVINERNSKITRIFTT